MFISILSTIVAIGTIAVATLMVIGAIKTIKDLWF